MRGLAGHVVELERLRDSGERLFDQLALRSGAIRARVNGHAVFGEQGKDRGVVNLDAELGQHAKGLVENLLDKVRSE